MENPSQKEESKGEEMLLYTTIYPSGQPEALDENNSDSKSCEENEETLQTGRWNQDEHIRFIKGCLLFGNNWKKVKKYVRTRSSAQIRSHAQKYLIKLNRKYLQQESYNGDFQRLKTKSQYDLKTIENIINNLHLPNFDMEIAEKAVLSRFKNSMNDKAFPNLVFDDFNFKSECSSVKKESKKKDKIFLSVKVPKHQKLEEMQKMLSNQQNNLNDPGKYNSSYGTNTKDHGMAKLENYIHSCLNSYDPNDLTKMLMLFNNNNNENNQTLNTTANESNGNIDNILNRNSFGGHDVNNQGYYANQRNIKESYDSNLKAFGLDSLPPETLQSNNIFEEKPLMSTSIKQEEEGQYFMGLLNDNIVKTKNNNYSNHQAQSNVNVTHHPSQYNYNNISSFQRNVIHSTNGQQSAFTHHSDNQNRNNNNQIIYDDIFNQILLQQNSTNHQLYQPYNN